MFAAAARFFATAAGLAAAVVMAAEQAAEAVQQAAAMTMAARGLAATAGLFAAAAGLFAAAARFFATAAGLTTSVTAQQAKERIRATGRAKHQGDGKRRKGKTSVHREDSYTNTGRETQARRARSTAAGIRH
jgi:hypothetical protein